MDKRLNDEWRKLNNVLIGTTKGGRNNQSINFISEGRTISAKCLGDVDAGDAIALRDDDGQWYVTSNQEQEVNSSFNKQIQYRKTVKKSTITNEKDCIFIFGGNSIQVGNIASSSSIIPGTQEVISTNIYRKEVFTIPTISSTKFKLAYTTYNSDGDYIPGSPRIEIALSLFDFFVRSSLTYENGFADINLPEGTEMLTGTIEYFAIGGDFSPTMSTYPVNWRLHNEDIHYQLISKSTSRKLIESTIQNSEFTLVNPVIPINSPFKYSNFYVKNIILNTSASRIIKAMSLNTEDFYLANQFSPDLTNNLLPSEYLDAEPSIQEANQRPFFKFAFVMRINSKTLEVIESELRSLAPTLGDIVIDSISVPSSGTNDYYDINTGNSFRSVKYFNDFTSEVEDIKTAKLAGEETYLLRINEYDVDFNIIDTHEITIQTQTFDPGDLTFYGFLIIDASI